MENYLKHCYPSQQKRFKALTDWVVEKSGMFSLKTLRHERLPVILQEIGFQSIQEENIS